MRLVEIDWIDTATLLGWQPVGRVLNHKPELCRSVGWVVRENKSEIVIAATRSIDDGENNSHTAGYATAIPKGCVKRIRTVKR